MIESIKTDCAMQDIHGAAQWNLTGYPHEQDKIGDALGVWPTLVDRRLGRRTVTQVAVGASWLDLVVVLHRGTSPSRPVVGLLSHVLYWYAYNVLCEDKGENMKEEFEEWAHGKIALAHYDKEYANSEAQLVWDAWRRAWNIAIREQRRKDEDEIVALKHKIAMARQALDARLSGERK